MSVSANSEDCEGSISRKQVLHAFRNTRRRYLIYCLKQNDGTGHLSGLSAQIAAWERNTTPQRVQYQHRKSVYNALHQTHLPRLERIGLVEYTRADKRVELTDNAKQMQFRLAADIHDDDAWPRYYLAVSVGAATVLPLYWIDVYPLSAVPPTVFAACVVAVFVALSTVHALAYWRWSRRFRVGNPDFLLEWDGE